MSEDRRYTESEIAAILARATEAQQAARRNRAETDGLTLEELQQIGREAGITPEFIARAAAGIDRADQTPESPSLLGLPLGAGRTVDLPGPLTDELWDRLVADMRRTFRASGSVRRDGSLREWRNGNLHVYAEPTETGHRLHFGTMNEALRSGLIMGLAFLAMGIVFMIAVALKGNLTAALDKTFFVSMFAVAGLAGTGVSGYRLTRWAKERERQFEEIADRALERTAAEAASAELAAQTPRREGASTPPVRLGEAPIDPSEAASPVRVPRQTRA